MASPQFFKSLFIAAITAAGVTHQTASAGTAPVAPRIEDEIAAHTEHFEPRIYQVGKRVYSAVGLEYFQHRHDRGRGRHYSGRRRVKARLQSPGAV